MRKRVFNNLLVHGIQRQGLVWGWNGVHLCQFFLELLERQPVMRMKVDHLGGPGLCTEAFLKYTPTILIRQPC